MPTAKDIRVAPVSAQVAIATVKRLHYSGTYARNSQLHLGCFLGDRIHGVMQFGPPMDKRKLLPLVRGTGWCQMLELNRMAFDDELPRNSESRAIGVALRMIKANYPQIKWVVSFADATQCGDGTIYRAAGFLLTGIKRNTQILVSPDGTQRRTALTLTKGRNILDDGAASVARYVKEGWQYLPGFQLRYVSFVDPTWRDRLTVAPIPYNTIFDVGAGMYLGERRKHSGDAPASQAGEGGSIPTSALQDSCHQGGGLPRSTGCSGG